MHSHNFRPKRAFIRFDHASRVNFVGFPHGLCSRLNPKAVAISDSSVRQVQLLGVYVFLI